MFNIPYQFEFMVIVVITCHESIQALNNGMVKLEQWQERLNKTATSTQFPTYV